ncbi:hypothetical protein BKA69DRAFT_467841 [Paraphysoderma sedebokerense]|nr:hypothetical protein BKA69DRAFT_467841 [Paraphysoderma sedebokerense]
MKIQSLPPFPRIGYDGLYGSGRKDAIYKVERTKAPVLSGVSTIAPGLPGILLFVPLYIENKYMDPAVNFSLTGVVSAVYDVNGIFNTSFSSSPNHYNMKTLVYDKSARSMLYESNPSMASDVADAAITSTAAVIDKEFEFVCSPYSDAYSSRYTALPIIVFVLSLVIVLFLVAIVHSMMTKYEIMKSRELSKRKELEVSKKMLNTLSQYSKWIVKVFQLLFG